MVVSAGSPGSEAVRDAVVAVIAEHGLEGTSVRRVATRAGVSIGAVQHHFPTKDAMLAAAMDRVEQLHRRRLEREVATLGDDGAAARLRAAVRSLVPRDEPQRAEAALWLAFVARAAVHGPTAEQHARTWERAEDGLARLVDGCAAAPAGRALRGTTAQPSAPAREAAAELLALADGLAMAVLLEPTRMPPARAHALLDATVDRLVVEVAEP